MMRKVLLGDVIKINPTTKVTKNQIVKFVSMDKLIHLQKYLMDMRKGSSLLVQNLQTETHYLLELHPV